MDFYKLIFPPHILVNLPKWVQIEFDVKGHPVICTIVKGRQAPKST